MSPGPDGVDGRLLNERMAHFTQRRFTYVHEWDAGDLVSHDNRNTIHTATWFNAAQHGCIMWRTTVIGNPGAEYAGDVWSWLPAAGQSPMGALDLAMRPPESSEG
ncbi:MAG: TauD/TfdA family dioxygenase [Proteobacteria bacterium]|nr:TauD/TfdA family dioxygenase [Pseudomonadota bacterium]